MISSKVIKKLGIKRGQVGVKDSGEYLIEIFNKSKVKPLIVFEVKTKLMKENLLN